jgi:CubicO group peptidase (beta-lactamase class C family)
VSTVRLPDHLEPGESLFGRYGSGGSTSASRFQGVIDVREGGEVVFEEAFGLAQRAERIPNTLGTRFAIASGTKTLTSIAVWQLVDGGGSRSTATGSGSRGGHDVTDIDRASHTATVHRR